MRIVPPDSNDLIIGMTLAELFLFVMLMIWLSVVLPTTPGGVSPPIENAILKEENKKLIAENANLKTELNDLQKHVEALRIALGFDPSTPLNEETLRNRIEEIKKEARRGAPVCVPDQNTLAEVTERMGSNIVVLRGHPEVLNHGGQWKADQLLTIQEEISTFLTAVLRYSKEHSCRFDYKLRYTTTDDYHHARTTYERYLYPETQTREP